MRVILICFSALLFSLVTVEVSWKEPTSEKHDSLGHGMEKKNGTRDSDTVYLGSDIPYESDRKEKFKMVFGKSKKDEKDPPSKSAQPQVGLVWTQQQQLLFFRLPLEVLRLLL